MSKRLENLNSIISVLAGGAEFYRKSARQVQNSDLETIFLEHAELREAVARDLRRVVEEAGADSASAAAGEKMRAAATPLTPFMDDDGASLVSALEELEDHTLAVFREALHHPDNARDETLVREYFEQFEAAHERMRRIKHADDTDQAASEQA